MFRQPQIDIPLHARQFEVSSSPARFRVLVAGRRFGKTHLALAEMLKAAQQLNKLFRCGSICIVKGASNPDSSRGSGLDLLPKLECNHQRMNIPKAVVTAAGPNQRTLALQTVIDRDGNEKSVLRVIVEEIRRANVDQIAIVIAPNDEAAYTRAVADRTVQFIHQSGAPAYANALYCARTFVENDPFLHLVGDHLYVSANGDAAAKRLVQIASQEGCSISAVQATRETQLAHYGTIGGQRLQGKTGLYKVEKVIEKPTPTEAEQSLNVSGLRAGHYLCFFGMHVLTPVFMELLAQRTAEKAPATVSGILAELANREQYLALELKSRRYDVGVKYGLFHAQLALALSGKDRDLVLSQLVENLAQEKSEAAE